MCHVMHNLPQKLRILILFSKILHYQVKRMISQQNSQILLQKNISFYKQIDQTYVSNVLADFDLNLLSKTNWKITNNKIKQKKIKSFLQIVECTKVTEISLHSNQYQHILHDIVKIRLPFLRKLLLFNNNIQSLEPLTHFQLPYLKTMFLNDNNIVNSISLRKMHCPNLQNLSINGNKINEFSHFHQHYIPKLAQMNIQWTHDDPQGMQVCWLAKLESNQLRKIYLRSSKRLTSNAFQGIKRKFNNIK